MKAKSFLIEITILVLFSTILPKEADELYKIFHIDNGRKYFKVAQIMSMIDTMAENNFNTLELAVGNNGLRFLLNDMTIKTSSKTFESAAVKKAINDGNKKFYDSEINELIETEMNTIIEYANSKKIEVFPLINSPGHMNAMLSACSSLLGIDCSYHKSKGTIDFTNKAAVEFIYALISKYIDYFASKKSPFFNMGADEVANDIYTGEGRGFGQLIKDGKYKDFVEYVNGIAKLVKNKEMTPVAFNDGFFFGGIVTTDFFLDKDIIVSYWSDEQVNYKLAKADLLVQEGYKIINTHLDWYYVLNWVKASGGSATFKRTLKGISSYSYNHVVGSKEMDVVGCMLCYWCDDPKYEYDSTEQGYLVQQITEFAKANPSIFS